MSNYPDGVKTHDLPGNAIRRPAKVYVDNEEEYVYDDDDFPDDEEDEDEDDDIDDAEFEDLPPVDDYFKNFDPKVDGVV